MFINDFSRYTWIYPMRQKNEAFGHFQKFKNEVEKVIGRHVWYLRSDRGKEYFLDEFTTYLRREGIRQEILCQHTSQQIKVAKHKNRNILEVMRAIMNETNPLKSYWSEVANMVINLMTRCTTSRVHYITPHERFYGKKLNLSHVRIFGFIFPMKSRKSSIQNQRSVSLWAICSNKKGISASTPLPRRYKWVGT